jgi:hypothetical protein
MIKLLTLVLSLSAFLSIILVGTVPKDAFMKSLEMGFVKMNVITLNAIMTMETADVLLDAILSMTRTLEDLLGILLGVVSQSVLSQNVFLLLSFVMIQI